MSKIGIFSIRWKIAFLFSLLSMLILSVSSFVNYKSAYETQKEKLVSEISLNVESAVNEINSWFNSRITAIETLRVYLTTPGAMDRLLEAGEDFNPYLENFNEHYGLNPYIGIAGLPPYYGGDFPQPPGYIVEERPWYKAAVTAGETAFTDYYIDSETKSLTTTLVTPLITSEGVTVVVATDLRLKELLGKLYSSNIDGASVMMIDGDGIILAHENIDFINTRGNSESFVEMIDSMLLESEGVVEVERLGTTYITVYKEIESTGWKLGFQLDEKILFSSLKRLQRSYILLNIVSMLIFAGFSIIIAGGINRKILFISNRLSEIAEGEGDLTASVQIMGRDELGALTRSFNKFLEKLSGLVSGIKITSEEITDCKNLLEENTRSTVSSTDEINSKLNSIGIDLQKLDSGIEKNAAASDKIHFRVREFDRKMVDQLVLVEQTTSAITEIMASIKNIVLISENKRKIADQLIVNTEAGDRQLMNTHKLFNDGVVKRLYDIQDITQVIKGIAGQINILSMNAAIEAAHAGEAGKGFAVVAEEVRKLAETSADSVNNIEDVIKKINTAVSETSVSVEKTADTFIEISKSVDDFTSAFIEISASTEELFEGGNQIIISSSALNEISAEVKLGAEEINNQISSMNGEFSTIKSFSSAVFKNTEQLMLKSENIVEASDKTLDIIGSLNFNTCEMNKQLMHFKTRKA